MDETLIQNWNSIIRPGDTVYHLGDFSFTDPLYYRKRLNGNILLIKGNHDKLSNTKYLKIFGGVFDIHMVKIVTPHIVLCHYPFAEWNGSCKGTWHLWGHSHGNRPEPNNLSFDIGVDCWNYFPVSYDQVKEKMEKKIENKLTTGSYV